MLATLVEYRASTWSFPSEEVYNNQVYGGTYQHYPLCTVTSLKCIDINTCVFHNYIWAGEPCLKKEEIIQLWMFLSQQITFSFGVQKIPLCFLSGLNTITKYT